MSGGAVIALVPLPALGGWWRPLRAPRGVVGVCPHPECGRDLPGLPRVWSSPGEAYLMEWPCARGCNAGLHPVDAGTVRDFAPWLPERVEVAV